MNKPMRVDAAFQKRQVGSLRLLTALFACLGPVAILTAAAVATNIEGDWWSELFYMYLALFTLLGFTTYFSLLTLLWELTRFLRRRTEGDLRDTPITRALHRILLPVAVAGLGTAVIIPLIVADLIKGGFALLHFAVGGILVALYLVVGGCAVIRRVTDRRRAEQKRLEDEKQAWEGYLN